MEPGAIPFAIIIWICGLMFIGIGIFSLKKKTPMHFWAGTTVKPEEISDITAYNKANGIMWISYGGMYILSGLFSLIYNISIGAFIVVLMSIPGLIVLIIVYKKIYDKYKI